jgi:hypothetical protein
MGIVDKKISYIFLSVLPAYFFYAKQKIVLLHQTNSCFESFMNGRKTKNPRLMQKRVSDRNPHEDFIGASLRLRIEDNCRK